jgi:isoquinoline 1-oxidoreductase beta subunit
MPQTEMGQGIFTAVAMILAEELDAAFDQVSLEAAPPNDKLYANPVFGIQVTGNSNSVRAFWLPLRKAAAGARAHAGPGRRADVESRTCNYPHRQRRSHP